MSTITKFDLSEKIQQELALNTFNHLLSNERLIELKEIKPTRSNLQNASLHLFFTIISDELRNMGAEFQYIKPSKWGLKLFAEDDIMSTPYTAEIVKKYMWLPIMKTLFNIESTTKLDTHMINEISDVLIKWFGEKGIYISFPNMQNKLHKEDLENGK